jgi:phospholipid/cholesterol/gamma-HCH transport system substrate-binding protein
LLAGIGVAASVLLVGTSVVVLAYGQGYYDDGYELTAVFATSSQGLYTDGGSDVKLRGINVGTVGDIELLDDGRARITLVIDPGVQIADTASATVEPLSVFGPKFVRIDPGEHELTGPFLAEGGEITETSTAVDLIEVIDQATALFERIDPQELVAIIDAVAEGVDGLGPELARTLDATAELVDVAYRHRDDVSVFLTDVASLATASAARGDQLVETVADLRALVPSLNERADDLDGLLAQTTSIATVASELLDEHRDEVDATIRAVAALVHGVYGSSSELPDLLDLVGTFFGRLADVIRVPGPNDSRLAALRGFIAVDPCLVQGICPG